MPAPDPVRSLSVHAGSATRRIRLRPMMRRAFLRTAGWLAGASVAQPFINRYAIGQVISIRLQTLWGTSDREKPAFDRFIEDVRVASNDTLAISILPRTGHTDDPLRMLSDGSVDGFFGAPNYFVRYDPGFAMIGDTAGAFESHRQQAAWFEDGGGGEIAAAMFRTLGLQHFGVVSTGGWHLVTLRPARTVDSLRGLRINLNEDFSTEVMTRAGVMLARPSPRRPSPPIDGFIRGLFSPDSFIGGGDDRYFLSYPYSVPVRDISIGNERAAQLSSGQHVLLVRSVRSLSSSVRRIIDAELERKLARIRGSQMTLVEWPQHEKARYRVVTNRTIDAWKPRSAAARRVADSIRQFQRRLNLP